MRYVFILYVHNFISIIRLTHVLFLSIIVIQYKTRKAQEA